MPAVQVNRRRRGIKCLSECNTGGREDGTLASPALHLTRDAASVVSRFLWKVLNDLRVKVVLRAFQVRGIQGSDCCLAVRLCVVVFFVSMLTFFLNAQLVSPWSQANYYASGEDASNKCRRKAWPVVRLWEVFCVLMSPEYSRVAVVYLGNT